MQTKAFQDDTELLYMTMVGVVMAAIFATGFHADVDRTLTRLAPEGTSYPFPDQTRLPAAKLTAAVGGFLLGVFFWTALGKLRWSAIRQLLKYRDWLTNPKSSKTKAWYFLLSSLLPRKRFLYTFQQVLPKYPLPSLKSTCQKTLATVEPLVSQDEFAKIKATMEGFEVNEGLALQQILEKRHHTENNWVADLWDKYAYLVVRTPLYYTNFCNQGGLEKADLSYPPKRKQCAIAANQTYHYMRFYQLIQSRTLPPLLVQDLVPICSHRYRYLYSCTRTPGQVMDDLKTYEDSKHIVVFRKGIMYRVEMFASDVSGEESLLSGIEIQKLFESIIDDTTDVAETQWNPSVFTGLNRTVWSQEREKLMNNSINKASLHDVESAIFHVVLEDTSPEGLNEECHSNLTSSGFNRWFDKSLTLVSYENGKTGGNVEHSTADATLTSRILEYIWGHSKYDQNGNASTPDALDHPIVAVPRKIAWNLQQFKPAIPNYLESVQQFAMNLDVCVLKCNHGKGAIKKLRVSPDSFMQMALQLAFYRMHQSTPKTYETAMTRFFKYGRTETIRTVSKHSVAFTMAMEDPKSTNAERIRHLKAAMHYHNNYKLEAMNGQAADRHLFGLYVASKLAGVKPKLFDVKVLMSMDQLSTSQSPFFYDAKLAKTMSIYPAGGGFAALREDGYGVYYLFLGDNFLTVHITSYRSCPETNSKVFGEKLEEAVADIKKLLAKK
ncbi:carnitine O-palmitoyltransferase 1, liver isoform-like [Clavelina lepadiformis]|uniref:carnitine O-palmitoyltransferase 1, liver isoform-like n=1 Tax=Clavelina lepadiformis TaxID=159417 RepID=UPI004042F69A